MTTPAPYTASQSVIATDEFHFSLEDIARLSTAWIGDE